MAETVTFIHAADLHIGAPFRGLRALSDTWADRMISAIPQAYDRLIDAAIRRNVDFVVIAGDVFDMSHPSYADFLHFFSGLKRLQQHGIRVYMCTGNHDPYTSWRDDFGDLPSNAYLFSAAKPDFAVFEKEGRPLVLLGSRGYYSQAVSASDDIAAGITKRAAIEACGTEAPFGVGVLHTGLHLDSIKAPTNPSTLLQSGMDYWALGHIHTIWQNSKTNPQLVFSGCIQGRDIKETGPHGCFEVTLTQGASNHIEFIPTASVVWQQLEVDVSECETLLDVKSHIMGALFASNGEAQCSEMVARITLIGRTGVHAPLADDAVREDLRDHINNGYGQFFCDTIIDETRPLLARHALGEESLFMSLVLGEGDPDEAKLLAYVEQQCRLNKVPTVSLRNLRMAQLQQSAEEYVVDLLEGGDDR